MKRQRWGALAVLLALVCLVSAGCAEIGLSPSQGEMTSVATLEQIPAFSGEPYVFLGNTRPDFEDVTTSSYETYSQLDSLGRCGVAEACVGEALGVAVGEV